MAKTILLKRSAVAGKVPTTGSLQLGELAVNTADGKTYIKRSTDDSVVPHAMLNTVNSGSFTNYGTLHISGSAGQGGSGFPLPALQIEGWTPAVSSQWPTTVKMYAKSRIRVDFVASFSSSYATSSIIGSSTGMEFIINPYTNRAYSWLSAISSSKNIRLGSLNDTYILIDENNLQYRNSQGYSPVRLNPNTLSYNFSGSITSSRNVINNNGSSLPAILVNGNDLNSSKIEIRDSAFGYSGSIGVSGADTIIASNGVTFFSANSQSGYAQLGNVDNPYIRFNIAGETEFVNSLGLNSVILNHEELTYYFSGSITGSNLIVSQIATLPTIGNNGNGVTIGTSNSETHQIIGTGSVSYLTSTDGNVTASKLNVTDTGSFIYLEVDGDTITTYDLYSFNTASLTYTKINGTVDITGEKLTINNNNTQLGNSEYVSITNYNNEEVFQLGSIGVLGSNLLVNSNFSDFTPQSYISNSLSSSNLAFVFDDVYHSNIRQNIFGNTQLSASAELTANSSSMLTSGNPQYSSGNYLANFDGKNLFSATKPRYFFVSESTAEFREVLSGSNNGFAVEFVFQIPENPSSTLPLFRSGYRTQGVGGVGNGFLINIEPGSNEIVVDGHNYEDGPEMYWLYHVKGNIKSGSGEWNHLIVNVDFRNSNPYVYLNNSQLTDEVLNFTNGFDRRRYYSDLSQSIYIAGPEDDFVGVSFSGSLAIASFHKRPLDGAEISQSFNLAKNWTWNKVGYLSRGNFGFYQEVTASSQLSQIVNGLDSSKTYVDSNGLIISESTETTFSISGGSYQTVYFRDFSNLSTKLNLPQSDMRVGIRKTFPDYALDVDGDIRAKDNVILSGSIKIKSNQSGSAEYVNIKNHGSNDVLDFRYVASSVGNDLVTNGTFSDFTAKSFNTTASYKFVFDDVYHSAKTSGPIITEAFGNGPNISSSNSSVTASMLSVSNPNYDGGNAISFYEGSPHHFYISSSEDTIFPMENNFTVHAVLQATSSQNGAIITKGASTFGAVSAFVFSLSTITGVHNFGITIDLTGTSGFSFYTIDGVPNWKSGSGEWNDLILRVDRSKVSPDLYVNGINVSSSYNSFGSNLNTVSGPIGSNSSPMYIGYAIPGGGGAFRKNPFTGSMAELTIWKRALTDDEIYELRNVATDWTWNKVGNVSRGTNFEQVLSSGAIISQSITGLDINSTYIREDDTTITGVSEADISLSGDTFDNITLNLQQDASLNLILPNSGSRLGIATSNPEAALHVVGDAIVTGILTAQEFHTEFVSASIVFQSGSTKFGDTADDKHEFTGSVNINDRLITGEATASTLNVTDTLTAASVVNTGDLNVIGDITASNALFGDNLDTTAVALSANALTMNSGKSIYADNVGYRFRNDADTRFYKINTGELGIQIDGKQAATILSGSSFTDDIRFGIGNFTTPTAPLHVVKSGASNQGNPTTAFATAIFQRNDTAAFASAIQILGGTAASSDIHFADVNDDQAGVISYDHSSNDMLFKIGESEKMVITDTSRVGIGTSSPNTILEVKGLHSTAGGFDYIAEFFDNTPTSSGDFPEGAGIVLTSRYDETSNPARLGGIRAYRAVGESGNYASKLGFFTRQSGSNFTERLTIDNNGRTHITGSISQAGADSYFVDRVAIGLSSSAFPIPSALGGAQLYVRGHGSTSNNWFGRIVAGGDNYVFLLGEYNDAGTPAAWLGAHTTALDAWAPLYINPEGNQNLYIGFTPGGTENGGETSIGGNVGIGVFNPTAKLHVEGGDVYVINSSNPRVVIGEGLTAGVWGSIRWESTKDQIEIGTSADADTLRIGENNTVGINIDPDTNDDVKLYLYEGTGNCTQKIHSQFGIALIQFSQSVSAWNLETFRNDEDIIQFYSRTQTAPVFRVSGSGGVFSGINDNNGFILKVEPNGNNGQVGINVDPTSELHVSGNVYFEDSTLTMDNDSIIKSSTGNYYLRLRDGNSRVVLVSDGDASVLLDANNNQTNARFFISRNTADTSTATRIYEFEEMGAYALGGQLDGSPMPSLYGSGSRVGINTITPEKSLQMESQFIGDAISITSLGNNSPTFELKNRTTPATASWALACADGHFSTDAKDGDMIFRNRDKNIIFAVQSATSYPSALYITGSNSFVGVGTPDPTRKLHVYDDTGLSNPQLLHVESSAATSVKIGVGNSVTQWNHTVTSGGDYWLQIGNGAPQLYMNNSGDEGTVGIGGSDARTIATATMIASSSGDLYVRGTLFAAAKSFDIPHPLDSSKRLIHGVQEGPEHSVYVRGKSDNNLIILPDYWQGLVDEDSITVQITPIGKHQKLYVADVSITEIVIENEENETPKFFYRVEATRKDIPKLEVEK